MPNSYIDQSDGFPDTNDVFAVLEFLISIELAPAPNSRAEWETALAPYQSDITRAARTLRTFAEQMQPATLEEMQQFFYLFAWAPQYQSNPATAATVNAYLNEAWSGVGPWQK